MLPGRSPLWVTRARRNLLHAFKADADCMAETAAMDLRRTAAQKHLASTLQGLLVGVDCRRFSRWEGRSSSHLSCFSDALRGRLGLGGMLPEVRWRVSEALEVFGRPEMGAAILGAVD